MSIDSPLEDEDEDEATDEAIPVLATGTSRGGGCGRKRDEDEEASSDDGVLEHSHIFQTRLRRLNENSIDFHDF